MKTTEKVLKAVIREHLTIETKHKTPEHVEMTIKFNEKDSLKTLKEVKEIIEGN